MEGNARDNTKTPLVRRSTTKPKTKGDKVPNLRRLLTQCQPATGTLIETPYFPGRGLTLPVDSPLMFHPARYHWPTQTKHPAMIAPIVNILTDEVQAVHQTFLKIDGASKAEIIKPRLYQGPKGGGVVKLTPDEDVIWGLAIGEGIETSLVGLLAGYPTWACLDADNLAKFPVLPGIECLTILADNDQRGLEAANTCAVRWARAGREARVALPQDEGTDWNDARMEATNV